ncbi:FUSC family protein [Streptomyces sp. NPDC127084]|uniref:FUSC family protein n=1 Tax=Streptomyces sp. NPDC127084 TaxID=3347133 RepID=UPI00365A29DB
MPVSHTQLTAVVRAVAVVTPLALGLGAWGTDRMSWGAACSFGAYLVLAAFPSLGEHPRCTVMLWGCLYLSAAAAAGAAAAREPLALVAGAILLAGLQGMFETAGGPLRMIAAMAALSFLLAGVNLASGVPWWEYAAAFAVGTLWQTAVTAATGPATGPAARQAVRLRRRGLPFAGLLAVIGAVGTATAWFIPLSHSVWLTTSALRVAKPQPEEFRLRVRARLQGTISGGVLAAVLLTPVLPNPLLVAGVAVAVFAMQLVGPSRYGWWTLCLTVVSLFFGMQHGTRDWELAATRIGLTIGGAALAVLAYVVFASVVVEGWLRARGERSSARPSRSARP